MIERQCYTSAGSKHLCISAAEDDTLLSISGRRRMTVADKQHIIEQLPTSVFLLEDFSSYGPTWDRASPILKELLLTNPSVFLHAYIYLSLIHILNIILYIHLY